MHRTQGFHLRESLCKTLKKFPEAKVLCIGDIILNRYLDGTVRGLSPEAPTPVLLATSEAFTLGGSGNILRNLLSLGVDATIVSVIGTDIEGETALGLLNAYDQSRVFIIKDQTIRTSVSTRYTSSNNHLLRTDRENSQAISILSTRWLIQFIAANISKYDAIIISDSRYCTLGNNTIHNIISIAATHGVISIITSSASDFSPYDGATALYQELTDTGGLLSSGPLLAEHHKDTVRRLIEEHGFEAVVMHRTGTGLAVYSRNNADTLDYAGKDDVLDLSNVQDTVTAILTTSLAAEADIHSSAILAAIGARLACRKAGGAALSIGELNDGLANQV